MPVCPACEANDTVLFIPARWLPEKEPVFRCRTCGTAFFERREPEPDYWQASGQDGAYAHPDVAAALRALHANALDVVERHRPGKGRLLDVGCGDGAFLAVARGRGWIAEGLDASEAGAAKAREQSGCKVLVGSIESAELEAGGYDVITMWDVIEHCPAPVATLTRLSGWLKPGGLLAIRTPDEGSFFRWGARALHRTTGGAAGHLLKYVYYHPHYVTFSADGLSRLLGRTGFTPECVGREETPPAFARAKIEASYARFAGRRLLCAVLPAAYALGRIFGRNKLFALAGRNGPDGGLGGAK